MFHATPMRLLTAAVGALGLGLAAGAFAAEPRPPGAGTRKAGGPSHPVIPGFERYSRNPGPTPSAAGCSCWAS